MHTYTISASIRQQRLYEVRADSEEEAKDILLEDYGLLDFDVLDEEIDDLDIQD